MNSLKITRLLMVQTGTYNDLVYRPYVTKIDTQTLGMFQEATKNGAELSPTHLAGVAGHILRPSTEGLGLIQIANGFNTRRFRFMMEIVNSVGSEFSGFEQVQYLCGYTDHSDVSNSMYLDPHMKLYFNSSVPTRRYTRMTPYGAQNVQAATDASHILVNRNEQQMSFGNFNKMSHLMRPQDVFYSMGVVGGPSRNNETMDMRAAFRPGVPTKSKRENTNTSAYLSKVLTTYRGLMTESEEVGDLSDIMAKGGGKVRDGLITNDPFLGQLMHNNYTSFMEGGSITYGELCALSPGLDQSDIVQVLMPRNAINMQGAMAMRGETEHWAGTNNETVISTIITQSVPALMMELLLTKVAFMATNQTIDGQFVVQILGGESFAENLDLTPYLSQFQARLTHEVLAELSNNNMFQIDLQCEVDLLGDTKIHLSLMGGPMIPFVMPSFCDALATPVIAPDARTLHTLAHDVAVLGDNLSVDHGLQYQQPQIDFTASLGSYGGVPNNTAMPNGRPYANSTAV